MLLFSFSHFVFQKGARKFSLFTIVLNVKGVLCSASNLVIAQRVEVGVIGASVINFQCFFHVMIYAERFAFSSFPRRKFCAFFISTTKILCVRTLALLKATTSKNNGKMFLRCKNWTIFEMQKLDNMNNTLVLVPPVLVMTIFVDGLLCL